jgi:hypothetical protein
VSRKSGVWYCDVSRKSGKWYFDVSRKSGGFNLGYNKNNNGVMEHLLEFSGIEIESHLIFSKNGNRV